MTGYTVLLIVGYIACVLLTVFILSLVFPDLPDEDDHWIVIGAIFWPATAILFLLIAVLFYPIQLGIHLSRVGEAIGRRRQARRNSE